MSKNSIAALATLSLAALAGCGNSPTISDAGPLCASPSALCGASCVDPRSDNLNCGACGHACSTGSACLDGSCVAADGGSLPDGGSLCASPSTVCSGSCIDPRSDNLNCGACDNACPTNSACIGGECIAADAGPLCGSPAIVCNGGCVDPRTDNANCGACDNACPTNSACIDGDCIAADAGPLCASPAIVCNGGCVDPRTDNANCGACDNACPAGEVCSGGSCAASCGAAFATCALGDGGAQCADLSHDPNDCGTCGNACSAGTNEDAVCTSGVCATVCQPGFSDCDVPGQCSTPVATDTANCGACGNVCPSGANQTPSCSNGACGVACTSDYGDCNGQSGDGCEVKLSSDLANCGACGSVCAAGTHQTAACSLGTCNRTCMGSYRDCDNTLGCETDVSSDNRNCGGCGNVCPLDQTCTTGTCNYPRGTLDQSYPYNNTDPSRGGLGNSTFQTYIAGRTGELGEVDYWGGLGGSANYALVVYQGAGTSGASLGSFPALAGTGGPIAFHVPSNVHISQVAGQTYTLDFIRMSGYIAVSSANAYANGCSDAAGFTCPGSAPYDVNFQTWVR